MSNNNANEKIRVRKLNKTDGALIENIVDIHLATFQGFFLTFMGKGFLKQMYSVYCEHEESGLLVAFSENDKPVGFLAYSGNMSELYKYMIKTRLIPFAWYSLGAFFRKPTVFMRLVRALLKPGEAKRSEKYMYVSSIGVDPSVKSKGVGSLLMQRLIDEVDSSLYEYISLDTDANDNDSVNSFYIKNGFVLNNTFETHEGRKMNEYRRSCK